MIEIRYGEHYEEADLVGKSVAEAREQYHSVFEIPARAEATLNGKPVKSDIESRMMLNDGDKLSFEVKSRRGLALIGTILAAIAITGGIFAYTWTTASATISATADSADYVTVAPYGTLPSFGTNIFGHYRGDVPTGKVFVITPDGDYTGDLNVKVYLTNADELTNVYKHLNMKLQIIDTNDVNVYASATGHTYQLLTLDNGQVALDIEYNSGAGPPFYIQLAGGSFRTHGRSPLDWNAGYEVAPQLFAEVTQR